MKPTIESIPLTEADLKTLTERKNRLSGWSKFLLISLVLLGAAFAVVFLWSGNTSLVISGILLVLFVLFLAIALTSRSQHSYVQQVIADGHKNVLTGTLTHKRAYANKHASNSTFHFGPYHELSLSNEDYDKYQVGDILRVTFSFHQPKFLDLKENNHAAYFELITPAAENNAAIEDLKRFDDELNSQLSGNEDKNNQLDGELKKYALEPEDKKLILRFYLSRMFVLALLGGIGFLIYYLNSEETGFWPFLIMGGSAFVVFILFVFAIVELTKSYKWLEMRYIDDIKSTSEDKSDYIYVKINGKNHTLKRELVETSDLQSPVILHRTPWRKYAFNFSLRRKE